MTGWRADRDRSLEELGTRRFDLLVIGGGIVGAATAAHASRAGLAVALVDAGDFGSGTSSASSKLVHGGLRYLRLGDVRLVTEAHHERRILTNTVAPYLVHRMPFLLPLYADGPFRPWFVQSGIVLYSALARSRLNWLVQPDRSVELVPQLRSEGLRSSALYADAWTNDARLCLMNVRAAAQTGATVVNHARVTELHLVDGRARGATVVDPVAGPIEVSAGTVVNAAGPWVDRVRQLEDPSAGTSVRLSKGVHALVPLPQGWHAALTIPQDDVRVTFAVPWYGMLLLGTTDTTYEGDPGEVAVEPGDVAQILDEASVAIPGCAAPATVRSSFAGLRVLPVGPGGSANARRETVFSTGPAGMLSVAGGKLTTYRRIALEVLERLREPLGLHRVDKEPFALPGVAGAPELPVEVSPGLARHLHHHYGSLTAEVLAPAAEDPTLLEPLGSLGPDIAAQALYAATHEWATTADDVLRRRTLVSLRGADDQGTRERTAALLARAAAERSR